MTSRQTSADILIIGGGHAGIEAAMAAAKLGCQVMMLTMNLDTIGQMSCNPAIGGPAKSQLVKEIDALGGVMGLCADATYLQMKTLNAGKGPAVRALRAQSDKAEYRAFCKKLVEAEPNIRLRQTTVAKLLTEPTTGICTGVVDTLGVAYHAKAVVITTGTFLNGRLWIGEATQGGGRPGESASPGGVTGSLIDLGMTTGRLKTGTPPRLDGRTVDTTGLDVHPGDAEIKFFSFLPDRPIREQLPCFLTRTNAKTHALIEANLHRSPMMQGLMIGNGPRYCPSIEDKVTRFADKSSHHLFIEPEGRDTYEMYLQGFSTCLPYDLQIEMIHTLPGLEHAEILRPACAVEYNYFPAYQLHASLMTKNAPGIFLAGQINGTSGYEEAAAQGLMAGINAVRYVTEDKPVVLSRQSSYIGTLIDDLITKEITEPYRMLTSRSEYRLLLRQDNADQRLTPIGREIGLVDDARWQVFQTKLAVIQSERKRLETTKLPPDDATNSVLATIDEHLDEKNTLASLLRRPLVTYKQLKAMDSESNAIPRDVADYLETEFKFKGYIQKQAEAVDRLDKSSKTELPLDLDYQSLRQLRLEARDKLTRIRPVTLGQARQIAGVTPADISVLQVYVASKR